MLNLLNKMHPLKGQGGANNFLDGAKTTECLRGSADLSTWIVERATDRATEEYFNEINTWRNEQVDINMDNEPEEAGQQDWVATRSGEADTQNNSLGWSTANIPVRTGTKPTEQKMMSAKGSSTFQRGPQWAWHVKSFQQVYSWQATPAVPTGV